MALAPGANTIVVEATDAVGNSGAASITVTLASDATPPTLVITAPPPGAILSDNQPQISVSFTDDDSGSAAARWR